MHTYKYSKIKQTRKKKAKKKQKAVSKCSWHYAFTYKILYKHVIAMITRIKLSTMYILGT